MDRIFVSEESGDEFVRFDEFEDVVLAIELVAMLVKDVKQQPLFWKWVIVGMQNAMQGAMVLALAGTDGCGALRADSQRANRRWLENITSQRPPMVMASYPELLRRIQKSELMQGPPFAPLGDDHRNLERLNELRRGFAHFNPTGWGIELNYLLNIMPAALNAFEFLLTTQDRSLIHFTDGQKTRVTHALTATRDALGWFKETKP